MKRAFRLGVQLAAAIAILGCHEQKNGAGAPASAAAAAPASRADVASSAMAEERARGFPLVVDVPPSAASGPAPESLSDSGRVLFDGARPGAALAFAAETAGPSVAAPSAPRAPAAGAARRIVLTSAGGRSPSASRGAAVPPPDSALLKAAAQSAGSSARGAGEALLGYVADQIACGYAAVYPVLSRAAWGAAKRRGSDIAQTPYRVTIHHTDGARTTTEAETAAAVREIQNYHMVGRAREGKEAFEDIGYHFLIDGAGRVVEGRHADVLGAHTAGANQGNIGVAMMGDFNKMTPTTAQVESLTRLVSYLAVKYGQDPSNKAFLQPHQHYNETDCPGKNMMAIFEDLRQRINREAQLIVADAGTAPTGRFQPVAVVDPPSA